MKYWFDTEFIEDGKTIDLLSIGMVAEDGREYYAECAEADKSKASDWVIAHVLPLLNGEVKPRAQIAHEIVAFIGNDSPEFWADYGSYDWIALCQLYGTMMALPQNWPMFVMDIQQLIVYRRFKGPLPRSGIAHNALDDARHCRKIWDAITHA